MSAEIDKLKGMSPMEKWDRAQESATRWNRLMSR